MTRTMIDIDDQALAEAARVLGTTSKKDTVNAALRETVARLRRYDAIRQMQEMADRGEIDLSRIDAQQRAEKGTAEPAGKDKPRRRAGLSPGSAA